MFPSLITRTGPSHNPFAILDDLFSTLPLQKQRVSDPREALPLDVFEEGGALCVEASLPGVSDKQLHVEIFDGDLSIRIDRSNVCEQGNYEQDSESSQEEDQDLSQNGPQGEVDSLPRRYFRRERKALSLRRVIALPFEVVEQEIEASLHDGVLRITLPKAKSAKPTRVAVNHQRSD